MVLSQPEQAAQHEEDPPPLLAGVEAQRRLEAGGVSGKIVLLRDHASA